MQLVWGSTKCTKVATQAAAEAALVPEAGTLSEGAPVPATGPGACKPRVDMCNEKASMNAFTYCVWNAPFSGPNCRGGCCFSSGKCASSSCAISGMGRDVPNMICYGVNSGVGFGGNSNCGGLACKLATPGCTTDAFGGNCVGTVVAFGSKEAVHPESLKFVGAPCLDATPSDTTLDRTGAPASGEEGVYMGKLWTVCDCAEGGTGLPEPASRLLNLTTSRISNFTKNEVLAAFSTFLPHKNVTDEANGKDKVVTLLPSFADIIKFPALSSIDLPSILGDLTGAKGGKDGQPVAAPKLPDLSGLLGRMKPADGQQQTAAAALQGGTLNPESGSLPNGTKVELMGAGASPAPEKPPRTLGSLLSRFTKPKNDSAHLAGNSSTAPGASNQTEADKASSTKVKPMTLGSLFGGLRRAGPDNSTAAPTAAQAPAGNSTRKLDLSPIGALINKFINGPQAAPPAAPATSAATTAANGTQPAVQSVPAPVQQQPATAAKIQAVPQPSQPAAAATPAASPAPRAPGPATLTVPKSGKLQYVAPSVSAPPPDLDLAPISAGHTPGDPNDRPKTLAERLREKKAQQGATKTVDIKDGVVAPPPSEAPVPAPQVRKSGFSANVPGLNLPPVRRPTDDPVWVATGMETPTLMLNLKALTNALQSGAGAGAEDLMQFGALLGQLQQVPGGLGALPADVSTALMTLAAEVNRVTSGGAPAAAPAAPAAAAQPADKTAEQPAAAATPVPAAAQPADKAAEKPVAVATPVPASAPAAATSADKVADKPAATATPADKVAEKPTTAAATPSTAAAAAQPAKQAADKPAAAPAPTPAKSADADNKEQPRTQQQQQQPVKASLASMPDSSSSSSKRETSATAPAATAAAASKEAAKQPTQAAPPAAAGAAAAAVPAARKSEAPKSSQDSASQPASAGAASKPAPAAADDKPAAAVASKPASAAAGAAAGPDKASAAATLPSGQPKAASKQQ